MSEIRAPLRLIAETATKAADAARRFGEQYQRLMEQSGPTDRQVATLAASVARLHG